MGRRTLKFDGRIIPASALVAGRLVSRGVIERWGSECSLRAVLVILVFICLALSSLSLQIYQKEEKSEVRTLMSDQDRKFFKTMKRALTVGTFEYRVGSILILLSLHLCKLLLV